MGLQTNPSFVEGIIAADHFEFLNRKIFMHRLFDVTHVFVQKFL